MNVCEYVRICNKICMCEYVWYRICSCLPLEDVSVIEWGDKLQSLAPKNQLVVRFAYSYERGEADVSGDHHPRDITSHPTTTDTTAGAADTTADQYSDEQEPRWIYFDSLDPRWRALFQQHQQYLHATYKQ